MSLVPHKVNRKGHEYYELVKEKWVNGKVIHKYAGYLRKRPDSKKEITGKDILPYVERLLDAEISDVDIRDILKRIGIDCDISPIRKIVLETDPKLKKTFIRIK